MIKQGLRARKRKPNILRKSSKYLDPSSPSLGLNFLRTSVLFTFEREISVDRSERTANKEKGDVNCRKQKSRRRQERGRQERID